MGPLQVGGSGTSLGSSGGRASRSWRSSAELDEAVEQLRMYGIPLASNSAAYTLVCVKPGIVLSSLTSTRSPSTKKSTRASPAQSGRLERRDRELLDSLAGGIGHPGWDDQLHPAGRVLGLVVVPAGLAGGEHDLARLGRDRIFVAEHRALDLEPDGRRLDDCKRVVLERQRQRLGELRRRSATRTIPTDDPSRAGLTNTGSPSAPSSRAPPRVRPRSGPREPRGSRPAGSRRAPSGP